VSGRSVRVYELYKRGFRLSCRTATYSHSTDAKILHVGAYSVRQAYHFAGRRMWGYPLGIIECSARGAALWTRHDGTTSHGPRFQHGQTVPRDDLWARLACCPYLGHHREGPGRHIRVCQAGLTRQGAG
jgi:hypothetical protein